MPGMRGGVLSPQDAKRLMSVLQEMTEYVDGEDLEGIAAQKPIYETGSEDPGMSAPQAGVVPPPDGEGMAPRPEVDVDALILEGPHGKKKGLQKPSSLDR